MTKIQALKPGHVVSRRGFTRRDAGLLVFASLAVPPAWSETWPSKTVRILVGTGAGGNPDTIARVFEAHMQRKGKTVLVENRSGAGGAIALRALVQAPADGYTLMSGASATHPLFSKDAGYRFEDLTPVSVVGVSHYGLLVSKKTGFNSVADLVAYAKAHPGQLNFAVIPATSHEIEVNNLIHDLGIQATTIPYKGMPEVYTAMVAGDIQATIHSNSPQVRQGQVRALAFSGDERQPDAPTVPTFNELHYDWNAGATFVFYARAGTPQDVLNLIHTEVAEMVRGQEFKDKVSRPLAIKGLALSPERSAKYVSEEYERVRAGVQRLGLQPQ
jgi:tripartite-type tricarboxylate transporter receptor subunit TctC